MASVRVEIVAICGCTYDDEFADVNDGESTGDLQRYKTPYRSLLYTCMYICVYINVRFYMYIHIYIHIHICI